MRDMSAPTFNPQPWCIQIDEDEDNFELTSGVIHHLPKFSGLEKDNPTNHLKEFHVICVTMKPHGVAEETFKLKAFPFSLIDNAKSWLMSLPPGSVRSWEQMQKKFMNKYFPPSKAAQIRKELAGINQFRGEALYEYLERFKELEQSCNNLGVPNRLLIEYFLDGMIPMERRMLDAAANGSVMNLCPEDVWELIYDAAENSRYFDNSQKHKHVANIESSSELQEVKEMLKTLLSSQKKAKACGLCSSTNHITSACPNPPDEEEEVNAVGGFPYNRNQQRPSDGNWRNNNYSRNNGGRQDRDIYVPPNRQQGQSSGVFTNEELTNVVKDLTRTIKKHDDTLDEIQKTLSKVATAVFEMQESQGKLPSQTRINPNAKVNAVTLRSGKMLEKEAKRQKGASCSEDPADPKGVSPAEGEAIHETPVPSAEINGSPSAGTTEAEIQNSNSNRPLPFPLQVSKPPKRTMMDKEVWDLFSKVEINIPLLDAIKQIPRYAKFLKELCTNRRRIGGTEQVQFGAGMSDAMHHKLPVKCKDPGTFTIPCVIGNVRIENCMLDLGASINVLPYSLYRTLRIGPLKPAGLTIQLADRSCTKPEGVIEDVLVQVGELVFPADFYVLKMENDGGREPPPILLGRPFMMTARTKIDTYTGTLSMEVEGEVIHFNIYKAMQHPSSFADIHALDAIDDLVEQSDIIERDDALEMIIRKAINSRSEVVGLLHDVTDPFYALKSSPALPDPRYETKMISLTSSTKLLPSVVQAPKLVLKPLPEHLKYIFLGEQETLPVIIMKGLDVEQEERLTRVLKQHKLAIGWTIADIRGISPTVCMHRILLEDGAKPSRQPQR